MNCWHDGSSGARRMATAAVVITSLLHSISHCSMLLFIVPPVVLPCALSYTKAVGVKFSGCGLATICYSIWDLYLPMDGQLLM